MSSHHRCCCGGSGACCVNFVCQDGLTPSECSAASGSYQGDGTTCDDNTCKPTNPACCGGSCGVDTCRCFIPAGATASYTLSFTGTWSITTCASPTTLCPAYTTGVSVSTSSLSNLTATAGTCTNATAVLGFGAGGEIPCSKGDCTGDPSPTNFAAAVVNATLGHAGASATLAMQPGFTCGGGWTVTYGATTIVPCRKITQHAVATRSIRCTGGGPFFEIGRLEGDIVFELRNMFDCLSSRPAPQTLLSPSKEILGPDGQPLTRDRAVSVAGDRCGDCGAERGMEGVRRMDDAGRVLGSRAAHRHRPWRVGPSRGVCAGSRGLGGLRRVLA